MSAIAIEAEAKVKANIPLGLIPRGFHYTLSITYPLHLRSGSADRPVERTVGKVMFTLQF
jgi:hypothetical protein